jgi:hypothetical protein
MSKQMLKDFQSFMEEVSSGKGSEWSHEHGSGYGWEDGDAPILYKDSEKDKPGAYLSHVAKKYGNNGNQWHAAHIDDENDVGDNYTFHKTAKDAAAWLKSKGHHVPDHHLTQLKARALERASEPKK